LYLLKAEQIVGTEIRITPAPPSAGLRDTNCAQPRR